MPIRSRKNQYRGVNAHLHSHFQAYGDWTGFHNKYIALLSDEIEHILPPNYNVDIDKSLQIREYHPDTGETIRLCRPEPDLTIYASGFTPTPAANLGSPSATLTMPIIETITLPDELYLTAVIIYQVEPDSLLGKPIAQLELLSRTNKPPGEGYIQYHEKRIETLKGGLKLVEIDYLHETESPIGGIPSYRHQHPHAYPYYLAISDPTPAWDTGQTRIYGFGVDVPIPKLTLPLAGEDTIEIDFNAVYHRTFESLRSYKMRVDYEQLPVNFERYSLADQARIRAVMERVQTAAQQGFDVENQLVAQPE